jgi:hypothetical protein
MFAWILKTKPLKSVSSGRGRTSPSPVNGPGLSFPCEKTGRGSELDQTLECRLDADVGERTTEEDRRLLRG